MNDQTSYICLFHSASQAEAAMRDLTELGIPKASIDSIMGGSETAGVNRSVLEKWGVPKRDTQHLMSELDKGGTVLALAGNSQTGPQIEAIFNRHHASQIDGAEAVTKQSSDEPKRTSTPVTVQDSAAVSVVEEELVVGKRTVHTGGVRIFSRIVETPVTQSVSLQEEHIHVERQAVNRPVSAADGNIFRERNVELSEMGQEAVVSKNARVVEEISVNKETSQHTERIQESVRHTELDLEEVPREEIRDSSSKR